MDALHTWISKNTWILHVFGIVLATVLINFLLRRILNRLQLNAEKTVNLWDDAVVAALRKAIENTS